MTTPRILIVFHTVEGQTARIADRLAATLRACGDEVDVIPVGDGPDVSSYDGVVVGGSIHAVHWNKDLVAYLREHAAAIEAKPNALFQVSLTSANPDDEHTATAAGLVHELVEKSSFDPDIVGLFAGALVYTKYGWFKRRIMRSISRHEGGDTDMHRDYEYTDWDAVEHFARDVDAHVRGAAGA